MVDALLWPDWLMLLALVASGVMGLMRGLTFEILSLGSWMLAWFAAQGWALPVAAYLHLGTEGSGLQRTLGFVIVFVAMLVVCRLLTWLVQQVIQATPLVTLDRLFGAAFGLVRGGLIVLAGVTVLGITPLARSDGWQASSGVRWAHNVIGVLAPSWSTVSS